MLKLLRDVGGSVVGRDRSALERVPDQGRFRSDSACCSRRVGAPGRPLVLTLRCARAPTIVALNFRGHDRRSRLVSISRLALIISRTTCRSCPLGKRPGIAFPGRVYFRQMTFPSRKKIANLPFCASFNGPNASGVRVALFSGNYNYVRDGANQALNKLVRHLLDHGAQVRVYSPTTSTPAFEPEGDLVPVASLPLPIRSEFRIALGLPKAIKKDVERFGPNIMHVSAPDWLGTGAQRFARTLGVPVVASMHTRFETYLGYYGLGLLKPWVLSRQAHFYANADHVLVPNQASATHARSMGVDENKISIWSSRCRHRDILPGTSGFVLATIAWLQRHAADNCLLRPSCPRKGPTVLQRHYLGASPMWALCTTARHR